MSLNEDEAFNELGPWTFGKEFYRKGNSVKTFRPQHGNKMI